ncbi:hypothetical protein N657DRAFT_188067 [Parathielavia appendiculata]|uniref:Uncharacterized protein n=1 Tax=Parathielavia appendiculata TaxID=2587402 RepID=A0AAN6U6G6_9PEZI|nr:hypothetical protein N657DRAFT_188067 [Parathielavia appendiculata]
MTWLEIRQTLQNADPSSPFRYDVQMFFMHHIIKRIDESTASRPRSCLLYRPFLYLRRGLSRWLEIPPQLELNGVRSCKPATSPRVPRRLHTISKKPILSSSGEGKAQAARREENVVSRPGYSLALLCYLSGRTLGRPSRRVSCCHSQRPAAGLG